MSKYCNKCCDPSAKSMVKIYRRLYQDVVRVPHARYVNIQTFVNHGKAVVFLRPQKKVDAKSFHEHHCRCKRPVPKPDMHCSLWCYYQSRCERKGIKITKTIVATKIPKFPRRKKYVPQQSPAL